jgi:DNA-binding LytR/AlgR family response regulator
MKCIIVADDPLACSIMQKFVTDSGAVTLSGVFTSTNEALRFIAKSNVDLIILDIEMPDLNGYEFLSSLAHRPSVIVVSANPENAPLAFDYEAVDFLLKPITKPRFLKAISKAQAHSKGSFTQGSTSEFIFVKRADAYIRVPVKEIQFIEADSDYLILVTDQGKFIMNHSLTSILNEIPNPDLIRIHRSYVVNASRITRIEENSVSVGASEIPVSKTGKKVLEEALIRVN